MTLFALALAFSLAFLGVTVEAVRRRLLDERYAVVWILVGLAMLALVLMLPFHLLDRAARAVGVVYPPSLLLLGAVLFTLILLFHLTLVVSRLSLAVTRLAQEVALLLADREGGADGGPPDPAPGAD